MHNLANTGRGLSGGAADADGSPYATGTSVLMGWALSAEASDDDGAAWAWGALGYWSGWSAAAWTGWCAMVPGDECGNTLIHELGHRRVAACCYLTPRSINSAHFVSKFSNPVARSHGVNSRR